MEDNPAGPKKEITSLDVRFLVKEMRKAVSGGFFRKIYQYKTQDGGYQFLFEVHVPGAVEKTQWIYVDNSKAFLTQYKKAAPTAPPSFCMFLRKHLGGEKIRDVQQHKFDRIIEILTDNNVLILELFSKGNVILCDSYHKIIMPMKVQRWKDRTVISKVGYKYPPSGPDTFGLDFDRLRKIFSIQDKKLVAILATTLGFGKVYANEICAISGIDGDRPGPELSLGESAKVHKVIELIEKTSPSPVVYQDFVSPFPLKTFKDRPVEKETKTVSEAFDQFFSGQEIQVEKEKQVEVVKKEEERVERIVDKQKESLGKWERIKDESKNIADIIYNNYGLIENIIGGIRKSVDLGQSWPEVKERIEREDSPEANAIKEIKEHEGIVVVEAGGAEIEIDFNKTIEENAERYYEDMKWAKKKLEGVKTSLESPPTPEPKEPIPEVPQLKERKKWYEKYKWFISSSGFLVIAGRNAEQNETVVKRYADPADILFHADIQGAAFVLIKSEGKEIDDITIKEAAEFSAANSKAWSRTLGTVDVYCFKPDQATKPEGGLDKGSFVIQGQRQWFRDQELKLSIGVKIDRERDLAKVLSGPVMAIRTNADYFVTLRPGFKESLELSREIKNKILQKCKPEEKFIIDNVPLEEFQKQIPSGKGEVVG